MYFCGPAFVDHFANGADPQPKGNADAFVDFAINDVFACDGDDQWVAVTAVDASEAAAVAEIIGDDWSAWTAEDAAEALQEAGIAAGKVQNARDLVEGDPQLAARDWYVDAEHSVYGSRKVDRFPAEFGGTPLGDYRAAPYFGEHTFEIYAERLGWDETQIAEAIGDGLFQ